MKTLKSTLSILKKNSSFGLLLILLTGCVIDNQQIVSRADYNVANPVPTSRDFAANNARHKVLMGIIDSGVDYNHPLLADHIHFTLNAQGIPTGLGRDFVGVDDFAAPFVVRTSLYDPTVSASDREQSQSAADSLRLVIRKAPELAPFLNPARNVGQEVTEGSYHGTHVAGLMTYDRPDFGLRAYRVLPTNRNADPKFDYTKESIDLIIAAIDQAAKDGVRVVNMSIGLDFQKKLSEDGAAEQAASKALFEHAARMTETMKKYPNILFVTAAGNAGTWKDGDNRLGMPCGVKAANVLCVGALRENGDPAYFTDIPVSGVDLVFALGHKVLSTLPTQMCTSQNIAMIGMMGQMKDKDVSDLAASLKEECITKVEHPGLGVLSGTSMASPIVAHIAAEVLSDNPNLDARSVIQEIYRKAKPSFIGTIPVYKLRIVKPSWYSLSAKRTLGLSVAEGDYWEAVVPAAASARKDGGR